MRSYISDELRRFVALRAAFTCEYCLISEEDTFLGCKVDHIVSVKHGGQFEPDNLAYACASCNRAKGSDVGSISPISGSLVRFFNPRTDDWISHFRIVDASIQPQSEIGEATARQLGFNRIERVLERQVLIDTQRYPPTTAQTKLNA